MAPGARLKVTPLCQSGPFSWYGGGEWPTRGTRCSAEDDRGGDVESERNPGAADIVNICARW